MKLEPIVWTSLDDGARSRLLQRPALVADTKLRDAVARIIEQVRADGDSALRALTRRFDGVELGELRVGAEEFTAAESRVGAELKQAIAQAGGRIEAFHRAGVPAEYAVDTAPGVRCERVLRPLDRAGLYVPAGSAPLPSTALMLGIPARIAGCREVVLCSPPSPEGRVDDAVLVAARYCGIDNVVKLGGAQAIAAMAFGSESVPGCDKLFGPGNAFVTEAKTQVAGMPGGPAIDMPAGPSEVLVIADGEANPAFVAADLLSQAEHGPDSQTILLTDSIALAQAACEEIATQAALLARSGIVAQALANARIIVVPDLRTAFVISNRYAPEHLIIQAKAARDWLPQVRAAGSVFLGAWSPEALGDYCSGTNHVLPTYGAARAYSGVSVQSFLRQITVQEVSPGGLQAIGPDAVVLARAERLLAHERAVTVRLAALEAGA